MPPYEGISQLTFNFFQLIASPHDFMFVPKSLAQFVEKAYIYRYRFAEVQSEILPPTSFRDRSQLSSDRFPLVCELNLPDKGSGKKNEEKTQIYCQMRAIMDMQTLSGFFYAPLHLYCERGTADGFLAEPLNFFSNAAFLILALLLFTAAKAQKFRRKNQLNCLAAFAGLIGIGSGLFHSYPNRLTQIADVLPIVIFVILSVLYYFKNLFDDRSNIKKPLVICLAWLALAPFLAHVLGLTQYLAQGEFYLGVIPALLTLIAYDKSPSRRLRLGLTALIFAAAYCARSLDPVLCPNFPQGTHYIWHLLTSASAFLMASLQMLPNSKAHAGD